MILWTLISLTLLVLMVREIRQADSLYECYRNPRWTYVATMWFIGSLALWGLSK